MNSNKKNKKALLALAIGGFGIGLTEFVIMGILPEVASALEVTIPEAGHFIAAYALGVVVGAPLLTGIISRGSSQKVLLFLMLWFTLFNTLSALSTNYWIMLLFRFLSGLPHGAFFGIGAVVAGKLAREGKSAQAIAIMFAGLTVANVIGVPIGTYIGQTYHWSLSFYMVGIVGVLTLTSLFLWMPDLKSAPSSVRSELKNVLGNGELWALIALTTIGTGGFFAWYSYIAPVITDVASLPENIVGYAMIIAGLGMVVGNFVGAKLVEHLPPLKSVVISFGAMTLMLIVHSFLSYNPYFVLILTFIIGLVSFSVVTPIQMAIIQTSRGSEMLGSAMMQSAFNMGNASGAYFAGLPMVFGYGVATAGLVGAFLAVLGVGIALSILWYRRLKRN